MSFKTVAIKYELLNFLLLFLNAQYMHMETIENIKVVYHKETYGFLISLKLVYMNQLKSSFWQPVFTKKD